VTVEAEVVVGTLVEELVVDGATLFVLAAELAAAAVLALLALA
jgi:hypothetical protein